MKVYQPIFPGETAVTTAPALIESITESLQVTETLQHELATCARNQSAAEALETLKELHAESANDALLHCAVSVSNTGQAQTRQPHESAIYTAALAEGDYATAIECCKLVKECQQCKKQTSSFVCPFAHLNSSGDHYCPVAKCAVEAVAQAAQAAEPQTPETIEALIKSASEIHPTYVGRATKAFVPQISKNVEDVESLAPLA